MTRTSITHPCECGCGSMTAARFIRGHNQRGWKHSPSWVANQSAGLRRAYAEGKFQHIIHQTPEFIEKRVRSLRGRKRPESVCKATAEGVSNAWKEGKYHKEGFCIVGGTAAHMAEIRKKVDTVKLNAANSEGLKRRMSEWKATGRLDDIRRKAGNAAGMPDHLAAKQWNIRSPSGIVYHFSNLAAWARRNTNLFVDDRPESKSPLWKRIAGGISDLLKINGRLCSYRGWVAVSKAELARGAPDLLNRDVTNPKPQQA